MKRIISDNNIEYTDAYQEWYNNGGKDEIDECIERIVDFVKIPTFKGEVVDFYDNADEVSSTSTWYKLWLIINDGNEDIELRYAYPIDNICKSVYEDGRDYTTEWYASDLSRQIAEDIGM